MTTRMNIIYGICSWGLGHATRSLPVMRKLIMEGHELTIISHGRSIELLQKELGENAEYISIPDYPMLLSENAKQFMAKSLIYWPVFLRKIESGLLQLSKILKLKKYDRIISDARYDMYSKEVPSFFISHQMRIMNPLRIHMFETGSELFNLFFFKRFSGVIVPDFREQDISGNLSHNLKKIDEKQLHYVGILSDFNKIKRKKDIDFLISLSGPEPQRSILENKMKDQIHDLKGNVVLTLGKTESLMQTKQENIQMYSFLDKDKREEMLNRSKLVISRSGYSTLMDLAVLGTKALLIPTPGQIEQEYLGEYHNILGTFYSVKQNKIQLDRDVNIAQQTTGIQRDCNIADTVENIIEIISTI